MQINHIYNVSSIVSQIDKDTVPDKNVYEKVNQIFKGAATGSPLLIMKIKELMRKQYLESQSYLDTIYSVVAGKPPRDIEKSEEVKS